MPLDKIPRDKHLSCCLDKAVPTVLLQIESFQPAKLRVSEIMLVRETMHSIKPVIQIILGAVSPVIEL